MAAGRLIPTTVMLAGAVAVLAHSGPPQAPVVFRTTTQLVMINAIVTDGSGRVVRGLTKDDFSVESAGRSQSVAEFSFVDIPTEHRAVDLDAPTRPASDVAVNAKTAQTSRAFVFVIVDHAIPATEMMPLKRALAALIGTLSPDDQVAMIYTGRSDLGVDFTNDFDRLIDTANNRRKAVGSGDFSPSRSLMITLRNVVQTLSTSRQARRAVFLIGSTGCSPVPRPNSMDDAECRDLIQRAVRADVPFYVVDPRLFINSTITSFGSADDRSSAASSASADRDDMTTLAAATGGRMTSGAGDPVRAAVELLAENGTYYLLGFYPAPAVNDGKFHEITVTMKRPGLHVRARRGYVAADAASRPSTATRTMTATLGEGLDDPGLPIRAFAAPIARGLNGRTRTLVTVELFYPRDPDRRPLDEDLRIGILALTPDSKIKASFQRPIHLSGTWLPTASGKVVINETIDLPSDKLALRIGVTSRALGKSGTAHLYVDPPDVGGSDLTLSGLVIGDPGETVDVAIGLDSLRAVVPFQPTTTRAFARGSTLRLFARAFWNRKGEDAATASIRVTGGEGLPAWNVTLRGMQQRDGKTTAVLDTPLALLGLASGAYVLEVHVGLPDRAPVTRRVPFDVR